MKVTDVAVAEGPRERTRSARASAQSGSLAASDSSPVGRGSASEFSLEVPVTVNTKAVPNSDEMVLHRPKVAKETQAKPVKLAKMVNAKKAMPKQLGKMMNAKGGVRAA